MQSCRRRGGHVDAAVADRSSAVTALETDKHVGMHLVKQRYVVLPQGLNQCQTVLAGVAGEDRTGHVDTVAGQESVQHGGCGAGTAVNGVTEISDIKIDQLNISIVHEIQ